MKGSGLLLKESRKVVIILCELAGGVVHSDGDNFELISSIIDFFEKICILFRDRQISGQVGKGRTIQLSLPDPENCFIDKV